MPQIEYPDDEFVEVEVDAVLFAILRVIIINKNCPLIMVIIRIAL